MPDEEVAYKPLYELKPEDITQLPKLDFISGLITYGQRIIKSDFVTTSGSKTLYKVPTGKAFFLTTTTLMAMGAAGHADQYIKDGNGNQLIRWYITATYADKSEALSISYSVPLIFYPGEELILYRSAAANFASGCVAGYEVSLSMLPNFLK